MCNDIVVTRKKKESNLNIRITPQLREEARIAAELRGLSVSALVHQYLVKVVREEKERSPAAFTEIEDRFEKPLAHKRKAS